jgi:small GTP-binding protein
MAIIDNEREVIVVRIVYDGPPLSGKTTSLYSLGKILGQSKKVYTPKEVEGHTIFFDWLDYTGGYFKGHSISCQIITVPGQNILKEHREFLLRSADAIIFVLDATHTEQSTLDYFWQTQRMLAQQAEETVKIVIQANKQDLEGALSSQQLKELFSEYPEVKVIETSATLGKGIRESFVLAVRLATERASLLMERGKLAIGRAEIVDGESLLAQLKKYS